MLAKHDWFCLFYPEPLDEQDFGNLAASGVKRVQLFLKTALARPTMLQRLAGMGVRVILRIEEDSYYDPGFPGLLRIQLATVKSVVPVEAVIVGNEPEGDCDLTFGSPNWGDQPSVAFGRGKAFEHAYRLGQVQSWLMGSGVEVVSPGWTCRRLTPNDPPQPGRATWGRICSEAYNACDYNGAHIYVHNWLGEEDRNRFLWELGNEEERCHKPVWINECNANKAANAVEHMRAVLQMADLVRGHKLGERVASFCPFCSNGLGWPAYNPDYIMRSRECYEMVAAWLAA